MREPAAGGAFKIRGAYNMVAQLTPEQRARGVITYSSGNHGQAMALAARELAPPRSSSCRRPRRRSRWKGRGLRRRSDLRRHDVRRAARRAEAEAVARGLTMVPPFDHEWIIAGQGTAGLEILEQLPDVAAVLVPIGGGGLVAGRRGGGQAVPSRRQGDRRGAAGAAAMKASVEAGHPVTLPTTHSVADGLMPVRPGDLTFAHVRRFVDAVVTVDDRQSSTPCCWIFANAKIVAEPIAAPRPRPRARRVDAASDVRSDCRDRQRRQHGDRDARRAVCTQLRHA